MNDRPMTIEEAREILAGDVVLDEHPSGLCCGVCGIPMHIWWSVTQVARHRRYHQAQATVAGAVAGAR